MRRCRPPQLLGLLLAFWFVLVGGEQAPVELCPMHGNLALLVGQPGASAHSTAAAMSHHTAAAAGTGAAHPAASHTAFYSASEGAPAPQHEHASCGCGGCCTAGLVFAVVPARTTVVMPGNVSVAVVTVSSLETRPRAPPSYARPFPTGPPRA